MCTYGLHSDVKLGSFEKNWVLNICPIIQSTYLYIPMYVNTSTYMLVKVKHSYNTYVYLYSKHLNFTRVINLCECMANISSGPTYILVMVKF